MHVRNLLRGSTGSVAAGVLGALLSLVSHAVSAKALPPSALSLGSEVRDAAGRVEFEPAANLRFASLASRQALSGAAEIDPLAFGRSGQSVTLELASPLQRPHGVVLRHSDVGAPVSVPYYLNTAAVPEVQAGWSGGDLWSTWPDSSSELARHMAAHEPQRVISAADSWWLLLVAVMLVVYQLRRKHIFLRPKPFGF